MDTLPHWVDFITKVHGLLQTAQPEVTSSVPPSLHRPSCPSFLPSPAVKPMGNSRTGHTPAYWEGMTRDQRLSMTFLMSCWPSMSLEPTQGMSWLTLHDITWVLTPKLATAELV
jgi:hypothetical protein